MQSFPTDKYVLQLPRCSGCLQDFGTARYPVFLVCKHVYCSLCLQRLKESSDYRCLYDGTLTPAERAKEDLGFYHRIDYFRRFLLTQSDIPANILTAFAQIQKEVNYSLTACRSQAETGSCLLDSQCPYSHTAASLEIARNFRNSKESCWECKGCMLTLTRKLGKCPVCDGLQEEKGISEGNSSRKEEKTVYSSLSFRPAVGEYGNLKVRPVARDQGEEAKSSTSPPDTARKLGKQKPCCQLQ